jgi:hypothetical protein
MTAAMRAWAVAAAVLGAVVAAAALAREVALAASNTLVWPLPHWWSKLTEGPAYVSWPAGAAAVLVAAAGVLAIVQLARGSAVEAGAVLVGDGDQQARVRIVALEHVLAVILARRVPELGAVRVSVSAAGRRVAVLAAVETAPQGLAALHGRAVAVAAEELRRAADLELAGLDLEVVRFTASDKEAA